MADVTIKSGTAPTTCLAYEAGAAVESIVGYNELERPLVERVIRARANFWSLLETSKVTEDEPDDWSAAIEFIQQETGDSLVDVLKVAVADHEYRERTGAMGTYEVDAFARWADEYIASKHVADVIPLKLRST